MPPEQVRRCTRRSQEPCSPPGSGRDRAVCISMPVSPNSIWPESRACARMWIRSLTCAVPPLWYLADGRRHSWWPTVSSRARPSRARGLNVHYRTSQRPCDAGNALDLGNHQTPKVIHIVGFGPNDHVIRAGDVIGLGYPGDQTDGRRYIGGLADLGLDEDISLDHIGLPVISVFDTLPQPDTRNTAARRSDDGPPC